MAAEIGRKCVSDCRGWACRAGCLRLHQEALSGGLPASSESARAFWGQGQNTTQTCHVKPGMRKPNASGPLGYCKLGNVMGQASKVGGVSKCSNYSALSLYSVSG